MRARIVSLLSAIGILLLVVQGALAQPVLSAAVLPGSRAVAVNGTATAFATIINAGSTTAQGCGISLPPSMTGVATLSYQTTNPQTNAVTGTPDTPASIAAGASQTFVFSIRPTSTFSQTEIALQFACQSGQTATSVSGVNTFQLTSSAQPTPDIVALAATTSNNGILRTTGTTPAAFSVAIVNVGAAGTVRVSAEGQQGAASAVVTVCQTNVAAACLQPPAAERELTIGANQTATISVFVAGTGPLVPLAPAENRVVVRFRALSGGGLYGATSVALQIDAPTAGGFDVAPLVGTYSQVPRVTASGSACLALGVPSGTLVTLPLTTVVVSGSGAQVNMEARDAGGTVCTFNGNATSQTPSAFSSPIYQFSGTATCSGGVIRTPISGSWTGFEVYRNGTTLFAQQEVGVAGCQLNFMY